MTIDWTKPFQMGRLTHHGLAKPGHPIFSDGPMIGGRRLAEWLGTLPKKTAEHTSSAPSSPTKDSLEE